MTWYVAVLVVACEVAGLAAGKRLFDRQIRLIEAATAEDAYQKALALGEAQHANYPNADGAEVHWRFVGLHDLVRLDGAPADGVEVYSLLERGRAMDEVVDKHRLTVFWAEQHADETTGALLDERLKPYAPD